MTTLAPVIPNDDQLSVILIAIHRGLQKFERKASEEVRVKDHLPFVRRSIVIQEIYDAVNQRLDLSMRAKIVQNGPWSSIIIYFEDKNTNMFIMHLPQSHKLPRPSKLRLDLVSGNLEFLRKLGVDVQNEEQLSMFFEEFEDTVEDDFVEEENDLELGDIPFGLILTYDGNLGVHTPFRLGATSPTLDRWLFEYKLDAADYTKLIQVDIDDDPDDDDYGLSIRDEFIEEQKDSNQSTLDEDDTNDAAEL
ncbi:hypothetical protein [Brevibacillus borstelensis]|uniref:hypothetical protein n=1 Tax=Brevibacillus borstelensis TaxID=45462 RepID=UPI0004687C61|nr:hypothetical protein [Brevibacillus borstelensis]